MDRLKTYAASLTLLVVGLAELAAATPPDYYASAEGKTGAALRQSLHQIIHNHTSLPYSSGSKLDTADALKVLDEDPANTNNVWLLYAQRSEAKATFGISSGWNREHQWCDSFELDGVVPAYSDLHNLRAEDANVNSARGNKFYDVSDPASAGFKRPAHAEALLCSTDTDSWEPPEVVKGDIARSLFYMVVRYPGDVANEPELVLTDETALIAGNTNLMGRFTTLLKWHFADPVSPAEVLRNDRIHALYQANRNPFVDRPEWVATVFIPPLNIVGTGTNLTLGWTNDGAPTMQIEAARELAAAWSPLTNSLVLSNNYWRMIVPRSAGPGYYRQRLN